MGHYATEMACPQCDNPRCTCPPHPTKPLKGWILHGEGAQPISVADYAKQHRPGEPKGLIELSLSGRTIYPTEAEAHDGRRGYIQQLIDEAEQRLTRLRSLLGDPKPKAKKPSR